MEAEERTLEQRIEILKICLDEIEKAKFNPEDIVTDGQDIWNSNIDDLIRDCKIMMVETKAALGE